jgi:hypothetical protein
MTTPNGTHPRSGGAPTDDIGSPEGPATTLRGAPVELNVRTVGRVTVSVLLAGLLALAAILFVAGAQKNSQINTLRTHGVSVEATVSGCLGLLGGSGSNGAGYTCRASFTFDGRQYNEAIPDNSLHRPGTTVRLVTVPDDPSLISTPGAVASDQASAGVYLVPALLLGVLVVLVGGLLIRRKGRSGA